MRTVRETAHMSQRQLVIKSLDLEVWYSVQTIGGSALIVKAAYARTSEKSVCGIGLHHNAAVVWWKKVWCGDVNTMQDNNDYHQKALCNG